MHSHQALNKPHLNRYQTPSKTKLEGVHYTSQKLAQFLASQIFIHLPKKNKKIRILDPAIGEGALVLALLDLFVNCPLDIEVIGFDINALAVKRAQSIISAHPTKPHTDIREKSFLAFALELRGCSSCSFEAVDVVLSNPPYIRNQVIGKKESKALAKDFNLSGRVDMAFAFLKAIPWIMKPSGLAGVIVPNRFMTTKAGGCVRKDIKEQFRILHIWDLGDTKLFDAAVLPATLLLKKENGRNHRENPKFSAIYEVKKHPNAKKHPDIFKALLSTDTIVRTPNGKFFEIKHGSLYPELKLEAVWMLGTKRTRSWLKRIKSNTRYTFGDLGTISVGVKTSADTVFIRDDWASFGEDTQPELLKDVITHHMGDQYIAKPLVHKKRILYPHEYRDGKTAPTHLNSHPHTKAYLEKNRTALESRKYLTSSGRKWYEIWVPQNPQRWSHPKIVFRDIVERPTFWLDFSGAIVNGDCYWMTLNDGVSESYLWLLLAVANSSLIERFYDYRFNNKLYAGRRRFITQYVKHFPVPDIDLPMSNEIIEICKSIYESKRQKSMNEKEDELNELVWKSFGF